MKKILSMMAISALLVSMTGCTADNNDFGGKGEEKVGLKPIPQALTRVQQTDFARTSNAFANKLLTVLSAQPGHQGKNVCVAPMSAQYMFSITANAVVDNSIRQSLVNALGFESLDQLNAENGALLDKLSQDDEFVKVALANSVWLDAANAPYTPKFKNTMEHFYKAPTLVKEIIADVKKFHRELNEWAKQNTYGLIEEVHAGNNILTGLLIANANCFDGKWAYPFDKADTFDRTFYSADGTEKTVKTMEVSANLNTYTDEHIQMAELPYGQGYYSMMLIMPTEPTELDSIAEHADWWTWHKQMVKNDIMIRLPRLEIKNDWNLSTLCDALDMQLDITTEINAGSGSTNFGSSKLVQSTMLKVDEDGTRAVSAAASENVWVIDPGHTVMAFNKPFLYAIRENTTGAILFMGKVVKL